MSRSYRRPYSLVTGAASQHQDRKRAARSFRRWVKTRLQVVEWESAEVATRLDAAHNNRWAWSGDGGPHWYGFPMKEDVWLLSQGRVEEFARREKWFVGLGRK